MNTLPVEEITATLLEIAEEYGHQIPNEHTQFQNCGVDSLEIVEMIMAAEQRYNINIPNDAIPPHLQEITIAQLAKVVSQYLPILNN